jgi:predicted GNAT superfamily acetyltransferase
MSELRFRDLHSADEFRQVMDLEAQVWGFTDLNDMVTLPVFTITVKRGAILIGAYDETDRMVGFVYSIVGMKPGQVLQWSHMLGVLPEYRNSGLGRALKLAQRDRALAQGYELIEWTYDPLQAMIARPHVARRVTPGELIPVTTHEIADAAPINTTHPAQAWLANSDIYLARDDRRLMLEIPMGFTDMQREAPALALEWRMQTREIFETYFRRGYRVVDFYLDRPHHRGRYLLAKKDA